MHSLLSQIQNITDFENFPLHLLATIHFYTFTQYSITNPQLTTSSPKSPLPFFFFFNQGEKIPLRFCFCASILPDYFGLLLPKERERWRERVSVRVLIKKLMLWMFPGPSRRRSLEPLKGWSAFLKTCRTMV